MNKPSELAKVIIKSLDRFYIDKIILAEFSLNSYLSYRNNYFTNKIPNLMIEIINIFKKSNLEEIKFLNEFYAFLNSSLDNLLWYNLLKQNYFNPQKSTIQRLSEILQSKIFSIKKQTTLQPIEIVVDKIHFVFTFSEKISLNDNQKINLKYCLIKSENNQSFKVIISKQKKISNLEDQIREIIQNNNLDLSSETLTKAINFFEFQLQNEIFIYENISDVFDRQFHQWIQNSLSKLPPELLEIFFTELSTFKLISIQLSSFLHTLEQKVIDIIQSRGKIEETNYIIPLSWINNLSSEWSFKELFNDKNFNQQYQEWINLQLLPRKITMEKFQDDYISIKNWKNLPLDTQYFYLLREIIVKKGKDFENNVRGCIIKGDNWEILYTYMNKFSDSVKLIFIDFLLNSTGNFEDNTDSNINSWLVRLKNFAILSHNLLDTNGFMNIKINNQRNYLIRLLMDNLFGNDNFRNEIILKRNKNQKKIKESKFSIETESLFIYSKDLSSKLNIPLKSTHFAKYSKKILDKSKNIDESLFNKLNEKVNEPNWINFDHRPGYRSTSSTIKVGNKKFKAPKDRHWVYNQKRIDTVLAENRLRYRCQKCKNIVYELEIKNCPKCESTDLRIQIYYDKKSLTSDWTDINSYLCTKHQNRELERNSSEILLKRMIETTTLEDDLIIDFSISSRNIITVAHKMNRKYIGLVPTDCFEEIILPELKRVVSGKCEGKSANIKWKGGGIIKYSCIKTIEETLFRNLK